MFFSGPVECRSSSLNSGTSDDTLSENGSSILASDYIASPEDPTPSVVPSTTAKPPPPLPTLFESRPQASSGYISNEQFDPFAMDSPSLDSPNLDSLPTPKLSTQDAASDSGYFPMPSMLDVQSTQVKQNGSQVSPSPNKVSPSSSTNKLENVGRSELLSSDYVAAPAHLSHTSPSSSSSSTQVKNSLASTSAAVAKKSRQLFAKVLPKKSSSSTPSKGSKTKSDTASVAVAQQQNKKTPQQLLAPPISSSSTSEVEENDDSDMGDLVDLLDLGDPVDQGVGSSPYTAANGNLSLSTSSDLHMGNSSGYFQGSSVDMGAPSSTLTSILTPDPFNTNAQSTVSATTSGYFQSPDSGGLTNSASTAIATTPYHPFSEDDDSDSFFLPDLPGDSDNNMSSSAGGGISYSGSIVTLSGGGQFPAFDDNKK